MANLNFGAAQSEAQLSLLSAILLYGHKSSDGVIYASHHPVRLDGGQPIIAAGKPLTIQGLRAMQSLLDAAGQEILPPNVLFNSGGVLAWWIPACHRRVFFRSNDDRIGTTSAVVPHPPLVMVVSSDAGWAIAALRRNHRPNADTALMRAPYMNVWMTGKQPGRICTGNVSVPKDTLIATMQKWEAAFFDSEFTHPNDRKVVKYSDGLIALTADLLAGAFKRFPIRCLLPLGCTLGEFVRAGAPEKKGGRHE